MSETITYGPAVVYTYHRGNCGADYEGPGHTCGEETIPDAPREAPTELGSSGGCSRCDGPFLHFRVYRVLGAVAYDLCDTCAEAFHQFMAGVTRPQVVRGAPVAGLG